MKLETPLDIKTILKSPNLAELISANDLATIGNDCLQGFRVDADSRAEWERKTKLSMDLALQVSEQKTFPWSGASNVKFPLVTIAAMQFHARAYPTLIPNSDIVKCKVLGEDKNGLNAARAKRIANHMSFQILEEDEDWEEEMDKSLLHQAIVGCSFKKTYYSPSEGHNESQFVLAKDLYVDYYTTSFEYAQRVTQVLYFTENDLYERYYSGIFLDWNRESKPQQDNTSLLVEARDKSQGLTPPIDSVNTPYEILEQHCYLDLDGDGYKEPYIVYLRKDTGLVLRIVARFRKSAIEYSPRDNTRILRIKPDYYFTKYGFIPSPDGGFYDLGFGSLLGPLNESINTAINQLIDAGTLSNTAGGFLGRGVKFKSGDNQFKPFEWKRVDSTGDDLRKGVFALPVREPSQVLFNLLGLLIEYGNRIGMATDPQVGVSPGQNTPAETSRNTLMEGQRIFNAVFKRTYRSLKEEFRKLYNLNAIYLPDIVSYYSISSGESKKALAADYAESPKTIIPAADPNMISDTMKQQQAIMLKTAASQTPGYDTYQVEKRFLEALQVSDIDTVFPDPKGENAIKQAPHPKIVVETMKVQIRQLELQLKTKLEQARLYQEFELSKTKMQELEARAIKQKAEARGIDATTQIEAIRASILATKTQQEGLLKAIEVLQGLDKGFNEGSEQARTVIQSELDAGGMGGMEEPSSNQPVPEIPEGGEGNPTGGMV